MDLQVLLFLVILVILLLMAVYSESQIKYRLQRYDVAADTIRDWALCFFAVLVVWLVDAMIAANWTSALGIFVAMIIILGVLWMMESKGRKEKERIDRQNRIFDRQWIREAVKEGVKEGIVEGMKQIRQMDEDNKRKNGGE